MSVIETLTEGIRARSLANEGEALVSKWEKTGLLEGLGDIKRNNMARLLENQAAQLLKETSSMAAGDVEGFAAVAFPIVRRVFGGLIAQDLVSVQPMSLPSGLIFFLDFTFSADGLASGTPRLANPVDASLYGGGVVGAQLTGGVDLANNLGERSFYSLNNGYASPTGSVNLAVACIGSGTYGDTNTSPGGTFYDVLRSDPYFTSGSSQYAVFTFNRSVLDQAGAGGMFNEEDLIAIVPSGSDGVGGLGGNSGVANTNELPLGSMFVRRLTQYSGSSQAVMLAVAGTPVAGTSGSNTCDELSTAAVGTDDSTFPIQDRFEAGGASGSIVGQNPWQLENNVNIPQIDIKVDSVAVTALSKKLKAKWTPELAQDLNAYHNLDAEVELTSILSEQIALEIDQEILADLVNGGTAATLYWSRSPGKFVNRDTGADITTSLNPTFTGTVSEWYETLLETINEVSARVHRKTLRGGANFVVVSPEVANILEFTAGFRAQAAVDEERGSWGAEKVGSLSRKMDVMVDPYFPRNIVLVGRRGSSFLESGYVYAPYVPLQVTPTIFGTEDFVPRKGVMTRYAKKMVRPDMYGLVIVADLVG